MRNGPYGVTYGARGVVGQLAGGLAAEAPHCHRAEQHEREVADSQRERAADLAQH